MVVGNGSRESPPTQGLPQLITLLAFFKRTPHDTPLGTKQSLMGGPGHQVRPFGKRQLEVGTNKPQHMGHVVHHHGVYLLVLQEPTDLGHRLPMDNHTLSEDDQFRPVFINQFLRAKDIYLIRVMGQHREIYHGGALGPRVPGHKVLECAHGLGAQVSSLSNMVVHHLTNPARLLLAVGAIYVVQHGAKDGGVGHLPADEPCLHFLAAEKFLHLTFQQSLHFFDKLGCLVVKNFGIVKRLGLFVLGIAEGRVHDRQEPCHGRDGHLRGNEIDALPLPPQGIFNRLFKQPLYLCRCVAGWRFLF